MSVSGNFLLLSDNATDSATFSGGSWTIPLNVMKDPRPSRRARSTNLALSSTKFRVVLSEIRSFLALALAACNFTSAAKYRIRAFADSGFTLVTYDSDWQTMGIEPTPSLDLEWESPYFWTGVVPLVDPDRKGINLIHLFPMQTSGIYWEFEFDDSANPDGFIDIGILFMGKGWQASINFSPDGNEHGYEPNTTIQKSLGGTRYGVRRKTARTLTVAFPYLPSQETWDEVDTLNMITGLDKQVFVIPDPLDTVNLYKRSFLGNLAELRGIQLMTIQLGSGLAASTGFKITEAL